MGTNAASSIGPKIEGLESKFKLKKQWTELTEHKSRTSADRVYIMKLKNCVDILNKK